MYGKIEGRNSTDLDGDGYRDLVTGTTGPPWGTLNAVNLGTGEVLWRVPLGNMRNLAPLPIWKLYGDVGVTNRRFCRLDVL